MSILDDLTSGDAQRIWAACGAVRLLRDRSELARLAAQINQIRQRTAGIELGGAVRPNSSHLAFALRKLEYVRDTEGCLCTLYTMDDFFNPEVEQRAGWVRILETVHRQGGRVDHYICECTLCGIRYHVTEAENHYTWWGWTRV